MLILIAAGSVLAYPGMKSMMEDIRRRQGASSTEPLGDLLTFGDSSLSPTAVTIKSILTSSDNPENLTTFYPVAPPLGSDACKADTAAWEVYRGRDGVHDGWHGRSVRQPGPWLRPSRVPRCRRLVQVHGAARRRGWVHCPRLRVLFPPRE
jgi:hypothetical protein